MLAATLALVGSACAEKGTTLNGSGATFPKPFYEVAIAGFADVAPDLTVNYAGGGSGKGKTDLKDQVVEWAGSDSPIPDADASEFKGGGVLYFPTVAAPITVSYNLSSVSDLRLGASALARIFAGTISNWNDPAVVADNPGVALPDQAITPVHRSDGSGTTWSFTNYLESAGGSDWPLGAGEAVDWPSGQAGNGNAGVAQLIKDTAGSIGYVDLSDAKASGLVLASIRNRSGKYVGPTLEGATAALESAQINDNLTYRALDTAGPEAYPITAGTYLVVYVDQPNVRIGNALIGWIRYVLTEGQQLAPEVDFAPLPIDLRDQAIAQIDKIQVG